MQLSILGIARLVIYLKFERGAKGAWYLDLGELVESETRGFP